MDNDTYREFMRYGIEGRKIEIRSRQIERALQWYSELPRETVEIPWRERWRRTIRDLRPRHLWRTSETRIIWPQGNAFGMRVTEYGKED